MKKAKRVKIDDGMLLMTSSGKKGIRFQDAKGQVAIWPNSRRIEFVFTTRRLPILGTQQVVLASLI